jgi:hypothetical protein
MPSHRRPDVVVYEADTIDVVPTRPEHVLGVIKATAPFALDADLTAPV